MYRMGLSHNTPLSVHSVALCFIFCIFFQLILIEAPCKQQDLTQAVDLTLTRNGHGRNGRATIDEQH